MKELMKEPIGHWGINVRGNISWIKNTETMRIDLSKVSNIVFEDIDYKDYPDFCDAYIVSAEHDGKEMTDIEIEELNEDSGFVHEKLFDYLF